MLLAIVVAGQEEELPKVFHMLVDDVIDPRTNRYTELGLEKAEDLGVDYVILELDTYGGALTDADDIRTRLLEFTIPVYTYINKDAASAGALISIATDSIYMAKGSSIGAATVVTGDGEAAPDKYQSYMRSIMRSTAEATGRDPKIAEGMVDEDIDVDSIATEGKVITFSVSEAIKHGFCEAQVEGIDDIMKRSGVEEYELIAYDLGASESIIAFFLNPFVSGILIMMIMGGIWFELQTPGVGFPLGAAILGLVLYLVPHYMNGLAENWEVALLVIGIILIAVEIFIIPGFGVAGVLGIGATVSSLILIMLNNNMFDFSFVNSADAFVAIITTFTAILGAVALLFILGIRITNSKVFQRIALVDTQVKEEGFTSSVYKKEHMVGKQGTSYTILRPSGKIIIEDQIYDAYTRGNYIGVNESIEVISDEGTSLKVKKI
ncbi:MAG: nodulation protein NfeD [Cytophagales bacterium]|nr:nodulation protein NfeD [Cytophagales bacterium]